MPFWLLFIGFGVTFSPQYLLGLKGMPRRIADYAASDGFTTLNRISSTVRCLLFLAVAGVSCQRLRFVVEAPSRRVTTPGTRRAWNGRRPLLRPTTTSCGSRPIRSQRPVWDYNHPEDRILDHPRPRRPGLVASIGGGTVLLEDLALDEPEASDKGELDR